MVKTPWTENDNYIVSTNYLAGIHYKDTAKILPHHKIHSIKLKYKNCVYLHHGNIDGSLDHASKMHIQVWSKLVSV